MIERELVLTGSDAELLSRALAEVKTKFYEDSEDRLDDTQALNALVSCFRNAEKEGYEKERHHEYRSLLSKRLVLGTLLDRPGGADSLMSRSLSEKRMHVIKHLFSSGDRQFLFYSPLFFKLLTIVFIVIKKGAWNAISIDAPHGSSSL